MKSPSSSLLGYSPSSNEPKPFFSFDNDSAFFNNAAFGGTPLNNNIKNFVPNAINNNCNNGNSLLLMKENAEMVEMTPENATAEIEDQAFNNLAPFKNVFLSG